MGTLDAIVLANKSHLPQEVVDTAKKPNAPQKQRDEAIFRHEAELVAGLYPFPTF